MAWTTFWGFQTVAAAMNAASKATLMSIMTVMLILTMMVSRAGSMRPPRNPPRSRPVVAVALVVA